MNTFSKTRCGQVLFVGAGVGALAVWLLAAVVAQAAPADDAA